MNELKNSEQNNGHLSITQQWIVRRYIGMMVS